MPKATEKEYEEICRIQLFDNKLQGNDRYGANGKQKPTHGNGDLSKGKDMPEEITLKAIDLAASAWHWDDGNITVVLQRVIETEKQDDFDD